MGADPLEGLRAELLAQRDFCAGRSPVYAAVLDQLAAVGEHGWPEPLREAWADRSFGAWYERPLLLLGSLREDALRQGEAHPLWRAIGAAEPSADAVTRAAVDASLEGDREHLWATLRNRHLQTNEPSRAVAWLWPAHVVAGAAPHRAVAVFDIGASAGLNLVGDRLPPIWRRGDGSPLTLDPLPPVESRTGLDLRPLDVRDEDDARWLRACVWPDQRDRLERLDAAIAAMRDDRSPLRIDRASAAEAPARLPRCGRAGVRAIAYQTIMRDYLRTDERRDYEEGMRRWLRECAPGSALWIELEVTTEARHGGPPAAITAHVATGADGPRTLHLAHCEPHPRVLEVDDGAVAQLQGVL